jgi:hypothetical protein
MHTPGPWWVTDSGVRDTGGYICHTNNATHYPDQDERYERETAERAANARLIAASPDLYDAAENALNALIGCCVPAGGVDDRKTILEAQTMLRAAIAKALGSTTC